MSNQPQNNVLLQIIVIMYLCSSAGIFIVITLSLAAVKQLSRGRYPLPLSAVCTRSQTTLSALLSSSKTFLLLQSQFKYSCALVALGCVGLVLCAHRSIAENSLIMLSAAPSEVSCSPIQYMSVDLFVFWCHYRFCSLYFLLRTANKTWV